MSTDKIDKIKKAYEDPKTTFLRSFESRPVQRGLFGPDMSGDSLGDRGIFRPRDEAMNDEKYVSSSAFGSLSLQVCSLRIVLRMLSDDAVRAMSGAIDRTDVEKSRLDHLIAGVREAIDSISYLNSCVSTDALKAPVNDQ